jgi:hypothetical protein
VSDRDATFEPAWGADGWPRRTETGLDEGDLLLIDSMLELTPRQRLESLRSFVGGLDQLRDARSIRPG